MATKLHILIFSHFVMNENKKKIAISELQQILLVIIVGNQQYMLIS